ncbi:MAG: hypothetical protein E7001_02490 [Coriobacteriaceae bacterium]|nr:hypothetical protein [Coriobacteriaceae bacterium]
MIGNHDDLIALINDLEMLGEDAPVVALLVAPLFADGHHGVYGVADEHFTSDDLHHVEGVERLDLYKMERLRSINPDLKCFGRFENEMVAFLAMGCEGFIGSTFNFMLPHYLKLFVGSLIGQRRLGHSGSCSTELVKNPSRVVSS